MGAPMKVTPTEVYDEIKSNGKITKDELAKIFNVCPDTISKKLRLLRKDGSPVLFDEEGLFILNKIKNKTEAEMYSKYLNWLIKTMYGISICGEPAKPLIIQSREYLKKAFTKDELKYLGNMAMSISKIAAYVEMEREMFEE